MEKFFFLPFRFTVCLLLLKVNIVLSTAKHLFFDYKIFDLRVFDFFLGNNANFMEIRIQVFFASDQKKNVEKVWENVLTNIFLTVCTAKGTP